MFLAEDLSLSYRVLTATNGVEAWDIVRHELPDIVVSDVMMPDLDVFSLTDLIKSDPTTNHIAVVLLTARTAQESRLEGLAGGADDYLTKPFNPEELHCGCGTCSFGAQHCRRISGRTYFLPENLWSRFHLLILSLPGFMNYWKHVWMTVRLASKP